MRTLTPAETEELAVLDRIEVSGIASAGVHGVYADEAEHAQPFVVDVTLWTRTDDAVGTDELTSTIDYVVVGSLVREVVASSPVLLLESLCAELCESLLSSLAPAAVRVVVHKPRAAQDTHARDVRVTLTRTR